MKKTLAFILLLIPVSVWATPSVTGVSGTISSGNSLTISGTQFGTHADYNATKDYLPLIWDDFESGTIGTATGEWSATTSNTSGAVLGSVTRPNSTYSVRQIRGESEGPNLGAYGDTSSGVTFMSCWRYFTGFQTVDVSNAKSWRIWPENTSQNGWHNWVMVIDGPTQSAINGSWLYLIENVITNHYGTFGSGFLDSWHLYEMLVDQDNDVIKVWYDGTLNDSNANASWGSYEPYRVFFDSYSKETDSPRTWTDDAYISHTQARVYLCEGATFTSRGQCEIQVPTAWGGTVVTIDANVGSFGPGEDVYLYAVDSDGTASTPGYPVSIAGATNTFSGTCTMQ